MTTELDDRLQRLSSSLYPPDSLLDDLPVDGYRPASGPWHPRLAAVLVPIVLLPSPAVILTVRSGALKSHAGQVALPGGGRCGAESFPLGTALRESQEEIGIAPAAVRVIGLARCFDTISAYRVVPVVGVLDAAPMLVPCPREVLNIFSVPLERVLEAGSYRRHHIRHRRRQYEVWSMLSERWPIWGATAAILAHLAELAKGKR